MGKSDAGEHGFHGLQQFLFQRGGEEGTLGFIAALGKGLFRGEVTLVAIGANGTHNKLIRGQIPGRLAVGGEGFAAEAGEHHIADGKEGQGDGPENGAGAQADDPGSVGQLRDVGLGLDLAGLVLLIPGLVFGSIIS